MSLELELEPESGQHDIAQVLVVRRNQGLGLLWPGSGGSLSLTDCEIICPLGRWLTCLMRILPRLLLFELWQRLSLSLNLTCLCLYSVSEAFLYLQVNSISPLSCNVLKYYWWLPICSAAPPSSRRSLLISPSIARVFDAGSLASIEPSRLGIFAILRTTFHCPATRLVGARLPFKDKSSAPAPAPALTPNPTNKPLSPDLLARRQAGFHSLSAASSPTCASSLPNASARSQPPIYRAAAPELFSWGQDGRRPRRPATANNPRTDIATELDLHYGLSLPSTAPGHLVDCGSGGCRCRCNFDVEPATDEVGGYSDWEHRRPYKLDLGRWRIGARH